MNREEAVRIFKERGNMVRVEEVSSIRKLVYPDMERLNQLLSDIYVRVDEIERKRREWKRQFWEERAVSEANLFVRLGNPLYRLHLWQKLRHSGYRHACTVVKPPWGRLKDHRFIPMLRKFVKDRDYRDKLVESRTSIFAPLASGGEADVKKTMILRRIEELEREIEKEEKYKEACMVMIDGQRNQRIFFSENQAGVYTRLSEADHGLSCEPPGEEFPKRREDKKQECPQVLVVFYPEVLLLIKDGHNYSNYQKIYEPAHDVGGNNPENLGHDSFAPCKNK